MTILDASLPDGWAWEPVSKDYRITKKPRGLALSAHERIPFVPMDGIPAGGRQSLRFEWRAPSEIASGTYFERGDVLLSKITPSFENGKQGLARGFPVAFGLASTEVIPLQLVSDQAVSLFLFYYLLHPDVRTTLVARMEGSTGRQRVPEAAVRDLSMPTPPKDEQQRIASVLLKVQRSIEIEDKLLATVGELKQAATRDLFTHGLSGETQKDTEIGLLPNSWSVQPLAELREFLQYGTSAKCDYDRGDNPVLRIPNVTNGHVDWADLKRCTLTEREVAKWSLTPGDVLFIRTNGVRERVGVCAVYQGQPSEALFASYLIRARLRSEVLDPSFFQWYTSTAAGTAQLSGRASPAADGKFNINTTTLDTLLVPLPRLDEQIEIAAILNGINRKLLVYKRKRAVLQDLFKTLLHELMTGCIRVADLDIDVSEVTAA
jgi:type I restriction enzyme S subunit